MLFLFSFDILCALTTWIQYDFVYQLFLDLYVTYMKFCKFLFVVSISLDFKTINWLKTSLGRLLNRLVGQARLLCKPSRALKKSLWQVMSQAQALRIQLKSSSSLIKLGLTWLISTPTCKRCRFRWYPKFP